MSLIFQLVLPMFGLIGLGFWAARWRGFTSAMAQGLSRFVGLYALPALLFASMAQADIPDPLEWALIASFYLAAFAVFLVGALWMRLAGRREQIATIGLASSFSNIAMLGIPIVMQAYGPAVAVPVMLLIVFQSPLLFTSATMLVEAQRSAGAQRAGGVAGHPVRAALAAAWATLTSPLVLGVALGLGANLLHAPVPAMVMKGFTMLGQAVLPCACFSLGATLAFSPASGAILPGAVVAVLKTGLHPLLTWLLATQVFHLSPLWVAPAVTAAALPTGINAYVFAERYGAGREVVSMSLLISTLLSPVSISIAFMVSGAG
ncbi:AEC family transporter [Azospirillum picis]|uniref:Permease n=1 Tax=Azospirillum picis TaxID=488438 RepID=A0ABU0MLD5_9PROT|nr:AEC family transporter [Azospirillum picis]MBP2300110.1 putative permease [Azospirillum picis]MDQ0534048.1 putative permease [Azospirillum picis]